MTRAGRLYDVRGRARRATAPLRNAFRYRTYLWLVDLDDLPRLPWSLRPLAGFRAADHLGDPGRASARTWTAFLAGARHRPGGGRVLMLANARVLGYVFNPLTVYWCHDADGALACVVAEVHNTYGERHRYLLRPDERGRAEVGKEFYVSPFFPVDGGYRMRLPEPATGSRSSITLHRPGGAAVRRQRARHAGAPATRRAAGRAAARHPWSTLAVTARIRCAGHQAVPARPAGRAAPAHHPQEGVR